MNGTIRKDSLPNDTIIEVKDILHSLGIDVLVVSKHEHDLFSSVRIEINGINGIGTNGKGINTEYSMASALGEFMERLQSGSLLYNYLGNMSRQLPSNTNCFFSLDEMCKLTRDLFEDIFDISVDEFKQFLCSNQQFLKKTPYFDVFEQRMVDLPDNLIFNICGSNGLCAGNSPLEAICQGIGEVLERMVLRKIYTNPELFPNVPDILIENLASYEIKKFLENRKYQCIVKDCSISGAFPVIGVLVLDPSKKKYRFSLASDLNLDIALQRCFTEIFQGYSFNMFFPMSMKKILDFDKIGASDWKTLDKNYIFQEMCNQAHDGSGCLPLSFLKNSYEVHDISVFNCDVLSNFEVFHRLLAILKQQGFKLYIKDYSYAGFPTYRIFISKASGAFQGSLSYRLNTVKMVSDLKDMLKEGDVNKIINAIHVLNENHINVNLEEIFHIKFQNKITNDLKKIEVFLSMKLKHYQEAYFLYSKYFSNQENNEYIKLYLLSRCYKNDKINFIESDYAFINSVCLQVITDFLNEYEAFSFPDFCTGKCECCKNAPTCLTSKIQVIARKLYSLYENHDFSRENYMKILTL